MAGALPPPTTTTPATMRPEDFPPWINPKERDRVAHGVSSNSPLPPSVETAYYRKCIELKRRINEIEDNNDTLRIKKQRIERAVLKMRIERAMLLEQIANKMKENPDDSDDSNSPPPTVRHPSGASPSSPHTTVTITTAATTTIGEKARKGKEVLKEVSPTTTIVKAVVAPPAATVKAEVSAPVTVEAELPSPSIIEATFRKVGTWDERQPSPEHEANKSPHPQPQDRPLRSKRQHNRKGTPTPGGGPSASIPQSSPTAAPGPTETPDPLRVREYQPDTTPAPVNGSVQLPPLSSALPSSVAPSAPSGFAAIDNPAPEENGDTEMGER